MLRDAAIRFEDAVVDVRGHQGEQERVRADGVRCRDHGGLACEFVVGKIEKKTKCVGAKKKKEEKKNLKGPLFGERRCARRIRWRAISQLRQSCDTT